MVFHWNLSDSKSPQVPRILFSILAVLNNAVVLMVSTRPITSKSPSPFSNPFVIVPKVPITIGIFVTCMFHNLFNSLARSWYLSFFSYSLSFILWSARTANSTILQFLFFSWLLLGLVFWPRLVIRLYVKVPKEFMCVIFYVICWVVHIPFVRRVKFKFLAHLPVDHIAHPVVSILILLLY